MKRLIVTLLIAMTLPVAACTTTVVARPNRAGLVLADGVWVRPPRPGAVWVRAHWERRGFHRTWVPAHWR